MMNDPEKIDKAVSDIISDEEIETFYKLLPKMQQAQYLLESLNGEHQDVEETSIKPTPYMVELNVDCIVSKKPNTSLSSPEQVYHEGKKFYIDFIVSDYKSFIDIFYQNVQESLTKTCRDLYPDNNKDDKSKEAPAE